MNQEDLDRLSILLADANRALDEAYRILYRNRLADGRGWAEAAAAGQALASLMDRYSVKV